MCIATACIVEACLLIPDHINFDHCLRVIKDLTDELRKEGDEWGGGMEDSYVTTLQKLSAQLDALKQKRDRSLRDQAESVNLASLEDPLGLPSPLHPSLGLGALPTASMPLIVMPEGRGVRRRRGTRLEIDPQAQKPTSHRAERCVVGQMPSPRAGPSWPSSGSIEASNVVTSGWLVPSPSSGTPDPSRGTRPSPLNVSSDFSSSHQHPFIHDRPLTTTTPTYTPSQPSFPNSVSRGGPFSPENHVPPHHYSPCFETITSLQPAGESAYSDGALQAESYGNYLPSPYLPSSTSHPTPSHPTSHGTPLPDDYQTLDVSRWIDLEF